MKKIIVTREIINEIGNRILSNDFNGALELINHHKKDTMTDPNSGVILSMNNYASKDATNLIYMAFILYYIDMTNDKLGYRDCEQFYSMWYPPYCASSYSMAAYYKRKMITENIALKENVTELLTMTDPDYREAFTDEYVKEVCEYVIRTNSFGEEILKIAHNITDKLNSGETTWWKFNWFIQD